MKLDGLGVILAIILLPIILVTTYYIQMQVDTIATENQYNTKLLDATYDAMSAFEMNTANEELSSVADSMRSLVLASNNIFLNTLATNFGISNASKEYLQPYIPAVLYTMYDGFYIYSPTETAKVAEKKEEEKNEDGDKIITTKGYLSVGDEGTEGLGGIYGDVVYEKDGSGYTIKKDEAKKETDYILKSYIQYSARYQSGDKDVTINYTLDNYLNIVGKIGEVYYTKTGYLIKDGLVSNATINGQPYDLKTHNEDDAKNAILGLKTNAEKTTIKAADSASVKVAELAITSDFNNIKTNIKNNSNIISDSDIEISTISEAEEKLEKFYEVYEDKSSSVNKNSLLNLIQTLEYEIGKCKAVAYYVSSACFSNWVYENLSDLKYSNIVDTAMTGYYGTDEEENPKYTASSGVNELYYDFSENDTLIFSDTEHPDPEDTESNFNTHRMEIIKNSIKYNLNLAMSAYTKMEHPYDCSLPVLTDEEWDKILSNISIVSFMQGWDCGLKIYNNYQIVSSTNNELTVTPDEIYYVKKDEFNNGTTGNYHRIDCPYLADNQDYISFKSKEVKYDKIYNKATGKYQYDHKNLACYTCINTSGYNSKFEEPKNTSYYDRINSLEDNSKKQAGYIALAKERQDIYKTNALPVSEGYEIIQKDEKLSNNGNVIVNDFSLPANKIKKIQITISETKEANTLPAGTPKEPVLQLNIEVGGKTFSNQAINLNQKKEQTITLDVSDVTSGISEVKFLKGNMPNYDVSYKVKSIKAIYK